MTCEWFIGGKCQVPGEWNNGRKFSDAYYIICQEVTGLSFPECCSEMVTREPGGYHLETKQMGKVTFSELFRVVGGAKVDIVRKPYVPPATSETIR